MNKKAIISIMTALTLSGYTGYISPGSTHTIVDNHPEMEKQGKEVMEQVESYMKDKDQVSLNEEMTIVNTYDYGKDVETYKLKKTQPMQSNTLPLFLFRIGISSFSTCKS